MLSYFPAITVLIGALLLMIFATTCSVNWEGELNEYPVVGDSQK